ncbi:MAG TPA: hypothetical protein VFU05_04545 [Cyclobacteriaceae bacterium]|nr:hypothetical protein [Cyclobacteriaceae bacterium]
MTFEEVNLCSAIIHALAEKGFENPTAIQQQTIRHKLSGRDNVA